jgi:hypothetical protein
MDLLNSALKSNERSDLTTFIRSLRSFCQDLLEDIVLTRDISTDIFFAGSNRERYARHKTRRGIIETLKNRPSDKCNSAGTRPRKIKKIIVLGPAGRLKG